MTTRAPFEAIVEYWRSFGPSFLWAPTTPDTWLLDRVKGLRGTVKGSGAAIGPGGIRRVVANSGDSWIQFPTNAGISGTTTGFLCIAAVSVQNPASVTGSFVKIGAGANGLGFGGGGTTMENIGVNAVLLREGLAWHVSAAGNAFVPGLNQSYMGMTAGGILVSGSLSSGVEAGLASTSWLAASADLYISGYVANRGTNAKVHAVAVFPYSLSEAGAFQNFRIAVLRPLGKLRRLPRSAIDQEFETPRQTISVPAPAASTLPTLSAPTFVSATSTSLTPRVTATWT